MPELLTSRQAPKSAPAKLADLVLIVRPPGRPQDIRTFTEAERADAERYATETGGTVEALN